MLISLDTDVVLGGMDVVVGRLIVCGLIISDGVGVESRGWVGAR